MEDEESLKTSALLRKLADPVKDKINNFLANGVVTTCIVVSCKRVNKNQNLFHHKGLENWQEALVLWFWVSTHVQKAVGLIPCARYWMDIFHIDLVQKLNCV